METLPLIPRHDLREIRGTYEEITAKSFYENTAVEDYLHITLTDEEDVPEAVARLRVIYPNLMKLSYDNTRTRSNAVIEGAVDVQRKSPLQLFGELYELQNNQPMTQIQEQYLKDLIETIWEGDA
jgi:exonuclease SbcD